MNWIFIKLSGRQQAITAINNIYVSDGTCVFKFVHNRLVVFFAYYNFIHCLYPDAFGYS
jgi:hypothetical protein